MICFSMPGHKAGRGYDREGRKNIIIETMIKGDLTEIEGFDNLFNAEDVLKEELELLSELYESKKSYFLINGSTSGNHMMIFSSLNEYDGIIVERNCHKSIMDGIIMRKLKPIYVDSGEYDLYDVPLVNNEGHIIECMERNIGAKAVIVTYPNYYGRCFNLEKVIKKAKELNMLILVDSAHGAHFGINDRLPKSAVKLGADMVVTSAHKTLPSMTQTAYLHINNEGLIKKGEKFWRRFSSTSPSYAMMMSMSYARYYLGEYGKEDYNELLDTTIRYREKIKSLSKVSFLEDNNEYINIDWTRYVLITPKGYSGDKLYEYLLENGIQCEMSNHRCVVLILSYFNTIEEFEKLYEVLKNLDMEEIKESSEVTLKVFTGDIKMEMYPFEADEKECEIEPYMECEGRISGGQITPYPPGIPLVNPGELISKEIIEYVKYCIENGTQVLGVNDGYIDVIKKTP